MPYVTVGKENGANIDIYYKDWGNLLRNESGLGSPSGILVAGTYGNT